MSAVVAALVTMLAQDAAGALGLDQEIRQSLALGQELAEAHLEVLADLLLATGGTVDRHQIQKRLKKAVSVQALCSVRVPYIGDHRLHLFWSEPRSVRGSAMLLLSPLNASLDTTFGGWRHGVITQMR